MEEQNNGFVVTLYTVIGDFSRVAQSVSRRYGAVTKELVSHTSDGAGTENLVISLQDDTTLDVVIRYGDDYVNQQIPGMRNYFSQAPCENTSLHKSVLDQISVFNCIANIHFERTEDGGRFNYLVNTAFDVAKDLTAILLLPSMELFTADQKRLLSIDGRTDFTEYVPIGNSDFLDQNIAMEPEDEARKQRSIELLKARDIPYIDHLKAAMPEAQATIRTAEEIAGRLFALFAVCVYSEAMRSESRQESMKYVEEVDNLMKGGLRENLSPQEQLYLAEEQPDQQSIINFSWHYECCFVLMWALGYIEELGYPEQPCDVSQMARVIWNCEDIGKFMKQARPRTKAELLDAADLILRYDWAAVDARINGKPAPCGLDGGVVYEWHYALNWLVGANGNAGWDHIQTHT